MAPDIHLTICEHNDEQAKNISEHRETREKQTDCAVSFSADDSALQY